MMGRDVSAEMVEQKGNKSIEGYMLQRISSGYHLDSAKRNVALSTNFIGAE